MTADLHTGASSWVHRPRMAATCTATGFVNCHRPDGGDDRPARHGDRRRRRDRLQHRHLLFRRSRPSEPGQRPRLQLFTASSTTAPMSTSWIRPYRTSARSRSTGRSMAMPFTSYLAAPRKAISSATSYGDYQKAGIIVNGSGGHVTIQQNYVVGLGPVNFIAQNGIQAGYGADTSILQNFVSGNSYTGANLACERRHPSGRRRLLRRRSDDQYRPRRRRRQRIYLRNDIRRDLVFDLDGSCRAAPACAFSGAAPGSGRSRATSPGPRSRRRDRGAPAAGAPAAPATRVLHFASSPPRVRFAASHRPRQSAENYRVFHKLVQAMRMSRPIKGFGANCRNAKPGVSSPLR